jgi:uncharacterized peroxidase-related enzyme
MCVNGQTGKRTRTYKEPMLYDTIARKLVQKRSAPLVLPCLPPDAPKASAVVYEEFHRGMGFPAPPNFILTQGHAANVARGSWEAVRNILVTGDIPRWIKELMFVAISVERDCAYCAAAHVACCRSLQVDPDWTDAVSSGKIEAIPDRKLRDMITFAVKAALDPQGLEPADYNRLHAHGLGIPQVVEIIGMAAFAVYANIVADATAMAPDAMFDQI